MKLKTQNADLTRLAQSIVMTTTCGIPTPINNRPAFYNLPPEVIMEVEVDSKKHANKLFNEIQKVAENYQLDYNLTQLQTKITFEVFQDPRLEYDIEELDQLILDGKGKQPYNRYDSDTVEEILESINWLGDRYKRIEEEIWNTATYHKFLEETN